MPFKNHPYQLTPRSKLALLTLLILALLTRGSQSVSKKQTAPDSEDLTHLRDQLKKLMAQQKIYNLIKKNGKLLKLAQQDIQSDPEQAPPDAPPVAEAADPTLAPQIDPEPPVEAPPVDAQPDAAAPPAEEPVAAEEPPAAAPAGDNADVADAAGGDPTADAAQTESADAVAEETVKSEADPASAGDSGGDGAETGAASEAETGAAAEAPEQAATGDSVDGAVADAAGETGAVETPAEAPVETAPAEPESGGEETTGGESPTEASEGEDECGDSDSKDECMEKKLKSKLVHLLSVFDNLYSSMEEVCQTSESVCKKILDRIKDFENLRPESNEAELGALCTRTIRETADNVFEIAKQQLEIKGEDNLAKLRRLIDEEGQRVDRGFQSQLAKFDNEEALKNQVSSQTTKVLKNTVESFYLNDYLKASESEESSAETETEPEEAPAEDPEDSLIKEITGDADADAGDKLTGLAEKGARKRHRGGKKRKKKRAIRRKTGGLDLEGLSDKTTLELLSSLLK